MPPQPFDPWLEGILLLFAVASLGTWFALWDRHKSGPILSFEPRQPVPWSGIWTLLPILFVVLVVLGASSADPTEEVVELPEVGETVERMAFGAVQEVALIVAFLTVMIVTSGAAKSDLGLPKNWQELARDVHIGFVAWLASIVPVYSVQIALVGIFGPSKGHPLVNLLEEQSNLPLFAMAFVVAVVVAPICEELMFRVLLQGWLEKAEDFRLGWRTPIETVAVESATIDSVPDESATVASASADLVEPADGFVPSAEPPQLGVAGLPYGWLPIVGSSILFALAHFGYGPEPVPLFVLALILGYVYQRTHRIVPSIVAHALFNGMTLFALWRVISTGSE